MNASGEVFFSISRKKNKNIEKSSKRIHGACTECLLSSHVLVYSRVSNIKQIKVRIKKLMDSAPPVQFSFSNITYQDENGKFSLFVNLSRYPPVRTPHRQMLMKLTPAKRMIRPYFDFCKILTSVLPLETQLTTLLGSRLSMSLWNRKKNKILDG